jgi:hypothetical protein
MENYPGNRLPTERKISARRYFFPNMSPICHLAHFTMLPITACECSHTCDRPAGDV